MTNISSKIHLIKTVFLFILFLIIIPTFAESSVVGYWKSIDDKTSTASGYWKLEIKDNQLLGYLINYRNMKPDHVCIACTGKLQEFFEKPIRSTPWINLQKNQNQVWKDGYIIDASKGKKYKAEIWLEDGDLKMRGYVGFLHRTQTWIRTDQATAEQATFEE